MSKKVLSNKTEKPPVSGFEFVSAAGGVSEYLLKSNGLRVLYVSRPETGVVTTNITYLVGARDEERGVTGVAHMLEHMMFKPTVVDLKNKIKSGRAMKFECNTGCLLNANTWQDRTTYYFSYPKKYFTEALEIEADRMIGVVLTDKALNPERNNVLSEFDMYNGDPHFALSENMVGIAFQSHPYGHETLGYRQDIEDYTAQKLEVFYRNYYRPDNAIMMVIGDVDVKTALLEVKKAFGTIDKPSTVVPRLLVRESKQEGLRRTEIERPSVTNIVSLGFKHEGFPTKDWFVTSLMLSVLTAGPESVLHKLLIDTGVASAVDLSQTPARETNLATINITLAAGHKHEAVEVIVLEAISSLSATEIAPLLKKIKIGSLTDELFARAKSTHIAQELTEYVSSGHWQEYARTEEILKSISTKDVSVCLAKSFINSNMTIGYFIGQN